MVINNKIYNKYPYIKIYTDCEYTINALTKWYTNWENNNWKKANGGDVQNKDLLIPIKKICRQITVKFEHVRAHTGRKDIYSICNQIADDLASQGHNS